MAASRSSLAQPAKAMAASANIDRLTGRTGKASFFRRISATCGLERRLPRLEALYAIGGEAWSRAERNIVKGGPQFADSYAARTRGGWVAGSSPAMVNLGGDVVIRGVGEEGAEQLIVEGVAGAAAFEAGEDGAAGEGQVADGVEDLVADIFVGEAEQTRVHQRVAIDHQRVLKIGAAAVTGGAKLLGFLEEAEGARGRDVALEAFGREDELEALAADGSGGEIDLEEKFAAR